MKQVLTKQGMVYLEEVPAPQVEPGRVLVQVKNSCISIGTEVSGVKASGIPIWKKVMKQPEKAKRVFQVIKEQGIQKTRSLIKSKLNASYPIGYSVSGEVIEVGNGVETFRVGDRVACGGSQYAHHAEIISVPLNLVVKIPENVNYMEASTVTLGAIALQGIRRLQPTLGEAIVVIGLGTLGQLTVQLLKANGCRVIGIDLDKARLKIAKNLGADFTFYPDENIEIEQVKRITDGFGADGVIITAATSSDKVISSAFNMCRKKGRVVLVGDVGLNLNRNDIYEKEIDFYISTSYGPGRYDDNYEEKGLDYPISYVRWTENRNMAEYLRLLSEKQIQLGSLIQKVIPIQQAAEAYEELKIETKKPLIALFSYKENPSTSKIISYNNVNKVTNSNRVKLALIGSGSFAREVHLPNLTSLSNLYKLWAVMSRTGYNASMVAKQYDASYVTTDYKQVLEDKDVDAVLIATRHHLHADMTLQALRAGKHVLVEKPLAINEDELRQIELFYEENSSLELPLLLTGFNRRFSKCINIISKIIETRTNPMVINYRMNAGYIPLDNWVHTGEGAGRNIGEACHIYDLFTYLTGSKVVKVDAHSIRPNTNYYNYNDNFVSVITFEDGSVATLTYTALGSNSYPKELMEIYTEGKVIVLDNYQSVNVIGANDKGYRSKHIDKGQREELEAFANTIIKGQKWPIPLWQQIQAMNIAFQVERKLKEG